MMKKILFLIPVFVLLFTTLVNAGTEISTCYANPDTASQVPSDFIGYDNFDVTLNRSIWGKAGSTTAEVQSGKLYILSDSAYSTYVFSNETGGDTSIEFTFNLGNNVVQGSARFNIGFCGDLSNCGGGQTAPLIITTNGGSNLFNSRLGNSDTATADSTGIEYVIGQNYNISIYINRSATYAAVWTIDGVRFDVQDDDSKPSSLFVDFRGKSATDFTIDNYRRYNGTVCPGTGPAPPEDTCTAPGSGDWKIDCSDNCVLNSPQDVPGDMHLNGAGTIVLSSVMTFTGSNQDFSIASGCTMDIRSGGELSGS